MNTLIGILTILLILVSLFLVLVILMQRASANSGMGSALGGGATESALGGDASNVLTKVTVRGVVIFFSVAFILFLLNMYRYDKDTSYQGEIMPRFEVDESAAETVESKGLSTRPLEEGGGILDSNAIPEAIDSVTATSEVIETEVNATENESAPEVISEGVETVLDPAVEETVKE